MKSTLLCPACQNPLSIESFEGDCYIFCACGKCPSVSGNMGVKIQDISESSQQAAHAKLSAAWDKEQDEIFERKAKR